MAGNDYVGYLKITGVNGECEDEGFKQYTKVLAWQMAGSSGSTVGQTKGSSGAGRVQHGPLYVKVYVDSAYPEFWDMMNKGTHKQGLQLAIRRVGEGTKNVMLVEMQEVYCSSATASHESVGELPIAHLTFTWGVARQEYFKQSAQGEVTSTGQKIYDATQNKAS